MTTERVRKPRWGFFKKSTRIQYFVWQNMDVAVKIEEDAEMMQLGQGLLQSWIIEEVYRNEDLRRHILKKLEDRPELADIRTLAKEYAREKRVQKGTNLWTNCEFCKKRIMTDELNKHVQYCVKRPKLVALPIGQMERDWR